MPDNPALSGWKSFSQTDEDGIVRECLRRIAAYAPERQTKTFIEVGCETGIECNTHQLVLDGYRGVWVEGNTDNVLRMEKELDGLVFPSLAIINAFIRISVIKNISLQFVEILKTKDIDFLSWDTDGNDLYFVSNVLEYISPKLLCVEYNAKFPPPTELCIPYSEEHVWDKTDFYGASLQAWVTSLPDYQLVCCNISGVNAFFVRKEFLSCFSRYDVAALYQPQRYWLVCGQLGHVPSFSWLRAKLHEQCPGAGKSLLCDVTPRG